MNCKHFISVILVTIIATIISAEAQARLLRDRMGRHSEVNVARGTNDLADLDGDDNATSCGEWATKVNRLQKFAGYRHSGPTPDLKDVAYGSAHLEKLDVFFAKKAGNSGLAPIIMMVHRGGWCVGDKAGASLTENKVARWVPKGFLLISANYPMVKDGSDALAQANHVAKAAAFVQANAQTWGGDSSRLILMGHSAGAHLVSLVNADARIRRANGIRSILGTVLLDSGAIDVVKQMPNVYLFLKVRYREAFGNTRAQWIAASPFHKLDRTASPWLGVCSTARKDNPCGQARAYAEKSNGLGISASVLPEPKSHRALNEELGLPGDYTLGVEAFMASLDSIVARLLTN